MKRRKKTKSYKKHLIFIFIIFVLIISFSLYQISYFQVLTIESPKNATYKNGIFINVSSSRLMKWMNISFDGEESKNQCIYCYNYTVQGYVFPSGTHTYEVEAIDTNGIFYRQTVTFTIKGDD